MPTIRPAALHEAQDIAALVNTSYAEGEGDLWEAGEDFRRTSVEEIEKFIGSIIVALGGDSLELAGCIRVDLIDQGTAPVAVFGMLSVSPRWRRRGLANALFEACVARSIALIPSNSTNTALLQCELLIPRDPSIHPHPLKEGLYEWLVACFAHSKSQLPSNNLKNSAQACHFSRRDQILCRQVHSTWFRS